MNETDKTINQVRTVLQNLKIGILNDFRNYSEPQKVVYIDNAIQELNMALLCEDVKLKKNLNEKTNNLFKNIN